MGGYKRDESKSPHHGRTERLPGVFLYDIRTVEVSYLLSGGRHVWKVSLAQGDSYVGINLIRTVFTPDLRKDIFVRVPCSSTRQIFM